MIIASRTPRPIMIVFVRKWRRGWKERKRFSATPRLLAKPRLRRPNSSTHPLSEGV